MGSEFLAGFDRAIRKNAITLHARKQSRTHAGRLTCVYHAQAGLNNTQPQISERSGYKEEGTTTTPFDMVVRNDLDRFHLVSDVIDRLPRLGYLAAYAKQAMRDKLIEHNAYIREHGEDMPEVKDWRWSAARPA